MSISLVCIPIINIVGITVSDGTTERLDHLGPRHPTYNYITDIKNILQTNNISVFDY